MNETIDGVVVTNVPMLKPNAFEMRKIRIKQYMRLTDYTMWEAVEAGSKASSSLVINDKKEVPVNDAERKTKQSQMKALSTLLLAIPNEYQHHFSSIEDPKALWEALEKRFAGTKNTKRNQKAILKQQYENFSSVKTETMSQTF